MNIRIFLILAALCVLACADPFVTAIFKGEWSQKSNPTVFLKNASGFALGSKVYVGTGDTANVASGANTSQLWEYDVDLNSWERLADVPGSPNGRTRAVGFALKNRGYLGLGANITTTGPTYYNDLWEFNPMDTSWIQKSTFPGTLRKNAVVFIINDRAYIALGSGQFENFLSDMWMFNPDSNSWTRKADVPRDDNSESTQAFSVLGFGYVLIQEDLFQYDPQTNTWQNVGDRHPIGAKVAFSIGSFAYAGVSSSQTGNNYLIEEFDPMSKSWSAVTVWPGREPFDNNKMIALVSSGRVFVGLTSGDWWEFVPSQ
jgi:N-acetylneuraminic acid mutarotase